MSRGRTEVMDVSGIGVAISADQMDDHFVTAIVRSLATPLIQGGLNLVMKVVRDDAAEESVYRHWAGVDAVSGVVLLEVRNDDPRVPLLRSLGFPMAGVVDTTMSVDFPAVVVDFDASIAVLRSFLETRPHPRAVYIRGSAERDAPARTSAIEAAQRDGVFEVIRTENSAEAAVATGAAALESGPATLVFDSDVHAVAALAAMRERGLRVPEDVAIMSRTNSALCQSASSTITAIDRRGGEIGSMLGARMLGALSGDRSTHDRAPEPFVVLGETA